jgi:hypothetical protein
MEKIRYLNVDCVLKSKEPLAQVISFLNNEIFLLWDESVNNIYSVGFETKLIDTQTPEEDILKLLSLLESLPSSLSKSVENCNERIFDIGFENGNSMDIFDFKLDAVVVAAIAKLGFTINIRIYPLFNPSGTT